MFRLASPVGQFWPFQWRTLLERLLTQPSVKDEGGARYIDDVREGAVWCSVSARHGVRIVSCAQME